MYTQNASLPRRWSQSISKTNLDAMAIYPNLPRNNYDNHSFYIFFDSAFRRWYLGTSRNEFGRHFVFPGEALSSVGDFDGIGGNSYADQR